MLPKVFMKSAISWKKYDTLITFERFLVVYHIKRASIDVQQYDTRSEQ